MNSSVFLFSNREGTAPGSSPETCTNIKDRIFDDPAGYYRECTVSVYTDFFRFSGKSNDRTAVR